MNFDISDDDIEQWSCTHNHEGAAFHDVERYSAVSAQVSTISAKMRFVLSTNYKHRREHKGDPLSQFRFSDLNVA